MKLAFEAGVQERHQVVFSFNKFTGVLRITVDGTHVARRLRVLSVKSTKKYAFSVGAHERHDVLIEKDRAVFFPAFRPQPCRAYVDGRLVADGIA